MKSFTFTHLKNSLAFLLVLTMFCVSCSLHEDFCEPIETDTMMYSTFKVNVGDNDSNTKSVVTIDTDLIKSIQVFAFEASTGNMLTYGAGVGSELAGKPMVQYIEGTVSSFDWILPLDTKLDIYAVANMPRISDPSDLESFLENDELNFTVSSMSELNTKGIPMSGTVKGFIDTGKNSKLSIPVARVVAKYNLRVVPDPDEQQIIKSFSVKNVRMCNMPRSVNLFSENQCVKSSSQLMNSGKEGDWATAEDLLKINSGEGVDFYVFENMQTASNNISLSGSHTWKDVKQELGDDGELCTYLELETETIYNDGSVDTENNLQYIYLGKDLRTNFDIRRNTSKKISLNHKDATIDDSYISIRTPSLHPVGQQIKVNVDYNLNMHPDWVSQMRFKLMKDGCELNTSQYNITASWGTRPSETEGTATINITCRSNVPIGTEYNLYVYVENHEERDEVRDLSSISVLEEKILTLYIEDFWYLADYLYGDYYEGTWEFGQYDNGGLYSHFKNTEIPRPQLTYICDYNIPENFIVEDPGLGHIRSNYQITATESQWNNLLTFLCEESWQDMLTLCRSDDYSVCEYCTNPEFYNDIKRMLETRKNVTTNWFGHKNVDITIRLHHTTTVDTTGDINDIEYGVFYDVRSPWNYFTIPHDIELVLDWSKPYDKSYNQDEPCYIDEGGYYGVVKPEYFNYQVGQLAHTYADKSKMLSIGTITDINATSKSFTEDDVTYTYSLLFEGTHLSDWYGSSVFELGLDQTEVVNSDDYDKYYATQKYNWASNVFNDQYAQARYLEYCNFIIDLKWSTSTYNYRMSAQPYPSLLDYNENFVVPGKYGALATINGYYPDKSKFVELEGVPYEYTISEDGQTIIVLNSDENRHDIFYMKMSDL